MNWTGTDTYQSAHLSFGIGKHPVAKRNQDIQFVRVFNEGRWNLSLITHDSNMIPLESGPTAEDCDKVATEVAKEIISKFEEPLTDWTMNESLGVMYTSITYYKPVFITFLIKDEKSYYDCSVSLDGAPTFADQSMYITNLKHAIEYVNMVKDFMVRRLKESLAD